MFMDSIIWDQRVRLEINNCYSQAGVQLLSSDDGRERLPASVESSRPEAVCPGSQGNFAHEKVILLEVG